MFDDAAASSARRRCRVACCCSPDATRRRRSRSACGADGRGTVDGRGRPRPRGAARIGGRGVEAGRDRRPTFRSTTCARAVGRCRRGRPSDGGGRSVKLSKPFVGSAGLAAVLAELDGQDGALRDAHVVRERALLARSRRRLVARRPRASTRRRGRRRGSSRHDCAPPGSTSLRIDAGLQSRVEGLVRPDRPASSFPTGPTPWSSSRPVTDGGSPSRAPPITTAAARSWSPRPQPSYSRSCCSWSRSALGTPPAAAPAAARNRAFLVAICTRMRCSRDQDVTGRSFRTGDEPGGERTSESRTTSAPAAVSVAAESGPVATATVVAARGVPARDVGDGVAHVDRRAMLAQCRRPCRRRSAGLRPRRPRGRRARGTPARCAPPSRSRRRAAAAARTAAIASRAPGSSVVPGTPSSR